MSRTRTGIPFCVFKHDRADVVGVLHQPDGADVDGLLAVLDEAAAGVDVVVRQRLLHLRRCSARRRPACSGPPAPGTRASSPPKTETSTTSGTDFNCLTITQSCSVFSSITS